MRGLQNIVLGMILGGALVGMLVLALYPRFRPQVCYDPTLLDIRAFKPSGTTVASVQRLDTDSDNQNEWVVTYNYDLVGGSSPVSASIYDWSGREFPVFYPYKLQTPDRDYLGEGGVRIGKVQLLGRPEGVSTDRPELVITGTRGITLSIFQVGDEKPSANPPCEVFPNPYKCAGFFRGNLRVNRSGDVVSVWDRASSDRSQLALRRSYRPSQASYFVPGTTTLLPPVESSVEFAYGLPADILQTPYPEKLVLAFYQRLRGGDPTAYLSQQAKQRYAAGQLDYGSPWPLASLRQVLVQEISYIPSPEVVAPASADVSQPQAAYVEAKVLFLGPGNDSRLRSVQWYLIKEGDQWRMHDAAAS